MYHESFYNEPMRHLVHRADVYLYIIVVLELCKTARSAYKPDEIYLNSDLAKVHVDRILSEELAKDVSGINPRDNGELLISTPTGEFRSVYSKYVRKASGNMYTVVNE